MLMSHAGHTARRRVQTQWRGPIVATGSTVSTEQDAGSTAPQQNALPSAVVRDS